MQLPVINEKLLHFLLGVLIHSLWQGILLGITAGIIMMLTKKSASAIRYQLLTGSLFIFIAGILCTVAFMATNSFTAAPVTLAGITLPATGNVIQPSANTEMLEKILSFAFLHSDFLVAAWLLVILYKSLRFISGVYFIHTIKYRQLTGIGPWWDSHVSILAKNLKISKPFRVFQSGIAKIPMVIGHIKPVILLPVGLINSLSVKETEAILLHELSHIKRNDYLVNMIQNLVELLFFFNPGLVWVSSLIKIERENCCDDMALTGMEDKKTYINALLYFQQYNTAKSNYAPALMGHRYQLLHRIKRIIYNNNKTLNTMEKTFFAACMIISIGILSIFSKSLAQKETKGKVQIPITNPVKDVNPGVALKNSIDTIPPVEEKRMPDSVIKKLKEYEVINKKLEPIKRSGNNNAQKVLVDAQALAELESKYALVANQLANLKVELQQKAALAAQQVVPAKQLEVLREVEAKNAAVQLHNLAVLENHIRIQKEIELKRDMHLLKEEKNLVEINNHMLDLKRNLQMREAELTLAKGNLALTKEAAELNRKSLSENLIADMIADGLIKGNEKLSFRLNNNELIINGKKQPAKIHKKFRDKYVKQEGWNMTYESNGEN